MSSDGWQRWVCALARNGLARYSVSNLCLILHANPYASFVAGFKAWLELGYWVRKGEHAIWISSTSAEIRLGGDPVRLPGPLINVARRVLKDATDAWLFPGQKAGHPTHSSGRLDRTACRPRVPGSRISVWERRFSSTATHGCVAASASTTGMTSGVGSSSALSANAIVMPRGRTRPVKER